MSRKDKTEDSNLKFQYHCFSSRQYQTGDLTELYRATFYGELDSRYAVSRILADPSCVVAQNLNTGSSFLMKLSGVVSIVPVIGGIAGGLLSVIGSVYGLYGEHKAITKAKHFMAFVENESNFKDFISNLTQSIVNEHAEYIETLPSHKKSIKWVHKKLSEKLDRALDREHNKDEKLVMTLAHAHAKIVIKAIEQGLDSHYKDANENMMKHAINNTFWDDYNVHANDHANLQKATELSGEDGCIHSFV